MFDFSPYLDRGVFNRLRDPALFDQVRLDADTACWPGGLDTAPETLFVRSTVVSVNAAST